MFRRDRGRPRHRVDAGHPFLEVAAAVSTCAEPAGLPGWHGTHCAGVIASRSPHRPGVAPAVRLLDVKVARADGSTRAEWLVQGIDAALDLEAAVLSISFGLNRIPASLPRGHGWRCRGGCCVLCRAAERAVARGALVVAAAGNERLLVRALRQRGERAPAGCALLCPGRARNVLTVGTLPEEPRGLHPWSRRRFGKPEIVAPGHDVLSTIPGPPEADPDDRCGFASGTSVSTAFVAGTAALLIGRRRAAGLSCSPAAIRRELLSLHA
jgi:serine protease AprX